MSDTTSIYDELEDRSWMQLAEEVGRLRALTPPADLPATLASVDDVRRVCEAAGLTGNRRFSVEDVWGGATSVSRRDGAPYVVAEPDGDGELGAVVVDRADDSTVAVLHRGAPGSLLYAVIQAARSARVVTAAEHRPSSEYTEALERFQRYPALTHVLQLGFAGEETVQHAAVIVREALRRESELDGWAALARIRDQFDCHELFVIGEDKPCGECPTCVASAALAARSAS